MLYAKIVNGKIEQVASLKSMFPNVSLPINPPAAFLTTHGLMPVISELPYNAATQKVVSIPATISGNQVITVKVEALTAAELAAKASAATAQNASKIRSQRDSLLTKTDWTQAADNPITNKAAWATYRQELRDITKQATFPNSVTWPHDPNYVAPTPKANVTANTTTVTANVTANTTTA